jgi:hypothetical protein
LTAEVALELICFGDFVSVFSLLIDQGVKKIIVFEFKHDYLLFLFLEKNQGKNYVLDLGLTVVATVYYNLGKEYYSHYEYTELWFLN